MDLPLVDTQMDVAMEVEERHDASQGTRWRKWHWNHHTCSHHSAAAAVEVGLIYLGVESIDVSPTIMPRQLLRENYRNQCRCVSHCDLD